MSSARDRTVDGMGRDEMRNLRTGSVTRMKIVEERGQPWRTPERALKATEVVPTEMEEVRVVGVEVAQGGNDFCGDMESF